VNEEIECLVVKSGWGYDRIVGAMANLGHRLSDQTVGNILCRHGLSPAPMRKQVICWRDFIRAHREVLVGTDFFTVEVLTPERPSGQPPLLGASPLRTGLESFPSSGSSIQ
jgi:putative transposase